MRALPAGLIAFLLLLTCPLPGQDLPGVAVERRVARELDLGVGDTIRLGPAPDSLRQRAVVTAVYNPVPDPARLLRGERHIRLHLSDLARLLGEPDRVDRFGIVLQPGIDPRLAAAELNRTAFGFRAIPSSEVAGGASRMFVVVSRFHRAIAVIAIAASAIFLLCLMLLKVEERRLDTAVLRLIGVRRRTVLAALVLEACLIALGGSVLGAGLAWVASHLLNTIYGRLFDTTLTFSWFTPEVVLGGVALSLTLGILAGFGAALRLVRTPPTVLWRRR